MDLAERFRILVDKRADPARLVAAQVLRNHATCCEEERILRVDVLGWRTVVKAVESGFSIGVMELAAFEKAAIRSWTLSFA